MTISNLLIKICSVIQLIGIVLSLYNIYINSTSNQDYELINSLLISTPFILLSLFASLKILLSDSLYGLYALSIVNLLQLIQFKILGLYYFYIVGPFFGIGIVNNINDTIKLWWDTSIYAGYIIIKLIDDKSSYFITLNIVALTFLLILLLEIIKRKRMISSSTINNPHLLPVGASL